MKIQKFFCIFRNHFIELFNGILHVLIFWVVAEKQKVFYWGYILQKKRSSKTNWSKRAFTVAKLCQKFGKKRTSHRCIALLSYILCWPLFVFGFCMPKKGSKWSSNLVPLCKCLPGHSVARICWKRNFLILQSVSD